MMFRTKQINYFYLRRIGVLLLFLPLFTKVLAVSADKKISLDYQDISIKQLFDVIERKWDVVFVYNSVDINDKQKIAISLKDANLNQTLSAFLPQAGITFQLSERYIFLKITAKSDALKVNVEKKISGKVVDEYLQPLQGVFVTSLANVVKAITDGQGNFSFSIAESDSIFTFRLLGYRTVKLSARNFMTVTLKPSPILLSDLLVVGYGLIPKKQITGSIVSLPELALKNDISGDVGGGFQGNVAGVYAINDRFRIRGISSINSSSEPLLVVDGVPQTITLKDLNPDDVGSVDFLKDAASAAIYGSRAANGVILVTTKSASFNSPFRLNLNYRTGFNFTVNEPDFLKGTDLLKVLDDAYYNRYPDRKETATDNPVHYFPFSSDYTGYMGYNRSWLNNFLTAQPEGTDWTKLVSRPCMYNDLRLSLQGGTALNNFMLSFSYRKNKDIIRDKSSDRITLVLKNDYQLSPKVKAGVSSNVVLNLSENSTYPGLTTFFSRSSLLPVYAPDGSGVLFDARNINDKKGTNPLYKMNETWDDNVDMNGILTAYLDVQLSKRINLRSDWSFTPGTRRYRYYQSKDFYREDEAIDPSKRGIILYARTLNYGFNGNNLLNYEPSLSRNHKLKLMLGNNIQSFNSDFNVARFEGFPTDYFQLTNANTEKVYTRQSAGMDGYRFLSFFNRTQYAYSDKWFVELNARADGTSRFAVKNRWGFFPGIGASWLASSEDFFKSVKQLDYLKLRTSYGYVGNAEVGNFPSESTVLNWAEYAGSPGFVFDRIANPEVKWEKQIQLNAGANMSVLQNRIALTFDYFIKRSSDLLINYNIGKFQGYFNTDVTVNTGSLLNTGFDFNLSTKNLDGKLKWKTEFNLSSFKTKITKLSLQQDYIEKGVNRVYAGYPMGLYFLPLWAGVDPETGHELIYEVAGPENNRQRTGNILDAESLTNIQYRNQRVLLKDKTPYPSFYGGINNYFTYQNWEISFLLSFQAGNWIYHTGMRQNSYVSTYDIQNKLTTLTNYWTPANKNSQIPLLYNSQMESRDNTRYLQDGSFVRLRNVLISYTLPPILSKKVFAKSVRFQLQGQNLITLTGFKQGDPEVSSGAAGAEANLSPGNAGLNYGQAVVIFGVNVVI